MLPQTNATGCTVQHVPTSSIPVAPHAPGSLWPIPFPTQGKTPSRNLRKPTPFLKCMPFHGVAVIFLRFGSFKGSGFALLWTVIITKVRPRSRVPSRPSLFTLPTRSPVPAVSAFPTPSQSNWRC